MCYSGVTIVLLYWLKDVFVAIYDLCFSLFFHEYHQVKLAIDVLL